MAPIVAVMMFFFGAAGFNVINGKVLSRNCSNMSCITPSVSISLSNPSLASPPSNNSMPVYASMSTKSAYLNKSSVTPRTSYKSHLRSNVGVKVAKWDFTRVQTPFVVCIWILIGSIAKIGMKMLYFFLIL